MDKNFLTSYRSTQWQEKKNTILTRDGYTCAICGKHGDEHTLMHVHHLTYKNCKNGKAWDCPDEDLVTLCEDCHEKVHSGKPFLSPAENYFYLSFQEKYKAPLYWGELSNAGTIAIAGFKDAYGNFISGCNILLSDGFCANQVLTAYTFRGGMLRHDATWIDGTSCEGLCIPEDFHIFKCQLLSEWLRKLIHEVMDNRPAEDSNTSRVMRCLNPKGFSGLNNFDFVVNFYAIFSRMIGYDCQHEHLYGNTVLNALMSAVFGIEWVAIFRDNVSVINTHEVFHKLLGSK